MAARPPILEHKVPINFAGAVRVIASFGPVRV